MNRLGLLVGASGLFLSACATQPSGGYEGTDRPVSELAVLSIKGGVIVSIDGASSFGRGWGHVSGVRLLPGEHRLALDCEHQGLVRPAQFTGRFEAGHFYQLTCHYQGQRRFAADMKDLGTSPPR